MEKTYTYDAFISYRHVKLDKYVAENLHRQLESMHFHKGKFGANLQKNSIRRIFRDKDELPISSDLADPIMKALQESEFLIVICSKSTPDSQWVTREIESFISFHDKEHVLTVLVEGEPADAFPTALLTSDREITFPDGTKRMESIPIEPLAADIRGKRKSEIKKNLKREKLRIAAALLHCGYDDLKQRHKEQKMKRTFRILSITCAIFVCFTSVSTYQALEIKKQSDKICEQSTKIEEQYKDILITSLNQQGDQALQQLEQEDRISSIQTAIKALPKNSSDTDIPYIPHVQYALTDALHVYENGSRLLADRIWSHETDINFMKCSPSKKRIMTVDSANQIHIWDTVSNKEISSFCADSNFTYMPDEDCYSFINENEIVYASIDSFKCYNFVTNTVKWEVNDIPAHNVTISPDFHYAALTDNQKLDVIDLTDGSICYTYKMDSHLSGNSLGETMVFDDSGQRLAVTTNSIIEAEKGNVIVIDFMNDKILSSLLFNNPYITSIKFINSCQLAIAENTRFDLSDTSKEAIFGKNNIGYVDLMDYSTGKKIWRSSIGNRIISNLEYCPSGDTFIIAKSYDSVFSLCTDTGETKGEMFFESKVINTAIFKDNTYGICFTRDGRAYSVDFDGGYIYNSLMEAHSQNIKDAFQGNGYVALLPYASRHLTVYRYLENPDIRILNKTESNYIGASINKAEDTIVASTYSDGVCELYGYEFPSGNLKFKVDDGNNNDFLCFAGNNDELFCTYEMNELHFYNTQTGKLENKIVLDTLSFINDYVIDQVADKLYLFGTFSYAIIDLNNQKLLKEYKFPDTITSSIISSLTTNGKQIIIANAKSGMLEEYTMEFKMNKRLSINASYISNMFYNDKGNKLFIVYKNNKTEIYDTEKYSLIATYDNLKMAPNKYISLQDNTGDYILTNELSGYKCTDTNELCEYIPYMRDIALNNNTLIASRYKEIYSIKLYNLDMLLNYAKQQYNEDLSCK